MCIRDRIQKGLPGMPVIILTAHGSIPDAVAATQQGVFSFLTKPVDKDALYKAIDEALEQRSPATDEAWRQAIVTRSPLMLRLLEQAGMVAQSDVSVLINGQSGTGKEIEINVRIISATHRDLPKAMARGEFREDLFYRLNVVNLKIPPLSERAEDIPLLANHLLRQSADRHKPFVRAFSSDAMKRLMAAKWPGNVRQLVNVIEQCVALTSSPVIGDALVEQALEGENTALPTFVEARNQFELNYLRKLLQITKGNVTHAARMAGRNRTEFYKLLSRHELDANDFKE